MDSLQNNSHEFTVLQIWLGSLNELVISREIICRKSGRIFHCLPKILENLKYFKTLENMRLDAFQIFVGVISVVVTAALPS